VEVESACIGDVHALIPALDSTKERELAPAELLADSLYGSDDNLGSHDCHVGINPAIKVLFFQ
jgi:hypothetical protein